MEVYVAPAEDNCKLNILVTGANGLVGRALCSVLDHSEDQVIRVVRTSTTPWEVPVGDLNEDTQWDGVLTCSVDMVVHSSGKVLLSDKETGAQNNQHHQVNTLGTANLERHRAKHPGNHFFFVSTVKVLGEGKGGPCRTDDRFVGSQAVDIEPLQEELGGRPPYTMQAGLAATALWYRRVGVSL